MHLVVPRLFALGLLGSACLCGLPLKVMAQSQIYQWTDETGQVIYSDMPPAADQGAVKLQMPAAPSAEDAAAARQRSDALSNQADEFASERLERERRAAAAKQAAPPVTSDEDDEDGDDYSHYDTQYPYYGAKPERPERRPIVQPGDRPLRPVQPIARPIRNR